MTKRLLVLLSAGALVGMVAACGSEKAQAGSDAGSGADVAVAADTAAPADTTAPADTAVPADTAAPADTATTGKDTTTTPTGAWTVVDSGTKNSMNGLVWSGSKFVASMSNSFLTSDDGAKWTEQKTKETMNWLGPIAWSGTTFAALGGWGGDTGVFTSPDGITWTDHFAQGTAQTTGIVWMGTQFVAGGTAGKVMTSPDGIKWTQGEAATFNAVAWSGKKLVAVGNSCSVATSTDGITWTSSQCLPSRTNKLTAVTWTGTQFVAVGLKGITLTSPDAVKWDDRTWDNAYDFKGVAGNDSQIVIVGAHGYPGIASSLMTLSADGKDWKKIDNMPGSALNVVVWTGKKFLAVGNDGVIVTSP